MSKKIVAFLKGGGGVRICFGIGCAFGWWLADKFPFFGLLN